MILGWKQWLHVCKFTKMTLWLRTGTSAAGVHVLWKQQRHRDGTRGNRKHFSLAAKNPDLQSQEERLRSGLNISGTFLLFFSFLFCSVLTNSSVRSRPERGDPEEKQRGEVLVNHGLLPTRCVFTSGGQPEDFAVQPVVPRSRRQTQCEYKAANCCLELLLFSCFCYVIDAFASVYPLKKIMSRNQFSHFMEAVLMDQSPAAPCCRCSVTRRLSQGSLTFSIPTAGRWIQSCTSDTFQLVRAALPLECFLRHEPIR